jgi:hypothetical protein
MEEQRKLLLRFVGKVLLLASLFFIGVVILCNISGMQSLKELSRGVEIAAILALLTGGAVYFGGWLTRRPARSISDQYVSSSWGVDVNKRQRRELDYLDGGLGIFIAMAIVSSILYGSSILLNRMLPTEHSYGETPDSETINKDEMMSQPSGLPTLPSPVPSTYYLVFNASKPPFDDVAIRSAFAHAIDKEALVSIIGGDNYFLPAVSIVPPEIWPEGIDQLDYSPLRFDPDLSVISYAASEYDVEDNFDWSAVVLAAADYKQAQETANFLRLSWVEVLGIEIESPNLVDGETYISYLERGEPHVYLIGWVADYNSPHNFLMGIPQSIRQHTGWNNPDYDDLVSAALEENDPIHKIELYVRAEEFLCTQEIIVVSLYHYYRSW